MHIEMKSRLEMNKPNGGASTAIGTARRFTRLSGATALTVAFGLAFTAVPLVTALPAFAQTVSPVAPMPTTPAPTVTSGQVIAGATCAQQLNDLGVTLDIVSSAAEAASTAADVIGLIAEGVGEAGQPFSNAATVAGVAAQVAAIGISVADQVNQGFVIALKDTTNNLPTCDTTFTGTVTVEAGGVNVTGVSIFNSDVGVDANVNVSGDVNANQVHAAQGISAHGGAIFLGQLDGTSYFEGITIGGGAIAGAGIGGDEAFTGDVSAIAIGNGASAGSINSTALGTGAEASGIGGTALGARTSALGNGATAIGGDADASGVGAQADTAGGTSAIAIGDNSFATTTTGDASIAIGLGASSTGSVSLGTGASSANGGTAIGDGSSATFVNSSAFGGGAAATRADQVVVGTLSNTYTLPGITSAPSMAAQSGPIEVVTTDAAGNFATDGGSIFSDIAKNGRDIRDNKEGIAMAFALQAPYVAPGMTFAMSGGYGNFEGSSALALSGAFRVSPNVQIDAGLGYGVSHDNLGGRVGVTVSW